MVRNMVGYGWIQQALLDSFFTLFAVERASWSANLPTQGSALWEDCPVSSPVVSANKADRSIYLLTLCILVQDFLDELTLLLHWLEATETPIYQAQSLAVNIIYKNLSCLTFSFLEAQFIKPKSKMRVSDLLIPLQCERKRAERPYLRLSGPCPLPDLSQMINLMSTIYCTVRVLSHTRHFILWSVLGWALPKPFTMWSILVKWPITLPVMAK